MQVEVGGTGLLGFCDASFTEQRTNIGRHWLNEHNWNRTWVLHSAGYFANGNVRDANVKNARFTAGDRILIKLNFFNEAAEFYRDSGGDTGGEEPRTGSNVNPRAHGLLLFIGPTGLSRQISDSSSHSRPQFL